MEFKRYLNTNYFVSDTGTIKNDKGYVLNPKIKNGAYHLELSINGKKKRTVVHRMVAIVYKPNISFPILRIKHIDGNKLNNEINNLEWI